MISISELKKFINETHKKQMFDCRNIAIDNYEEEIITRNNELQNFAKHFEVMFSSNEVSEEKLIDVYSLYIQHIINFFEAVEKKTSNLTKSVLNEQLNMLINKHQKLQVSNIVSVSTIVDELIQLCKK